MNQRTSSHSIKKLFIANRGEIARRIAKSARKNNITCVAIAGKSRNQNFLREYVDEFFPVEEETTSLYLNPKEMIRIALKTNCDALHPGFGFLSENSQFADMVLKNKLNWIGPSPSSIEAMASKSAARKLAKSAGVPVVPGIESFVFDPNNPDLKEVYDFADKFGFPILFKAAMGGGGKGMRVARNKEEILSAATRAYSEGVNSFGDGTLIVEKYLEFPRHIEIQILGDQHGQIFSLSDRECSIQRRHQKIIEEAPAPFLPESTRERMHEAAVSLAKLVNYHSAGTVEMLIDYDPQQKHLENLNFYFLEMNTRLQVEHPVTEEVLGIDLVDLQLQIAEGRKLNPAIMQREPRGHAIELRIYAEDVRKDFQPSPGTVECFVPHYDQGIRWEIGLNLRDKIDTNFDPMISKLIAWGCDRNECISRLIKTLQQSIFIGPRNNISYLESILSQKVFQTEASTTKYVNIHRDELLDSLKLKETFIQNNEEKILSLSKDLHKNSTKELEDFDPIKLSQLIFGSTSTIHDAKASPNLLDSKFSHLGSFSYDLLALADEKNSSSNPGNLTAYIHKFMNQESSNEIIFQIKLFEKNNLIATYFLFRGECSQTLNTKNRQQRGSHNIISSSNRSPLKADLPSKVVKVLSSDREKVSAGQLLLVLESMKMEFEILSPTDGTIEKVFVKEGELVKAGETLVSWMEEIEN